MSLTSVTQYQPTDLPGVLDLLTRELPIERISIEDFRRKVLLDPNFRPQGALVARNGDRVVGFVLGIHRRVPMEDAQPDFDRGWITLMAVDKEYQHRGIGTELLNGVMEYLRSEGSKSVWVSPYAPNYFTPGVDEAVYPGAIEFLKKRGFETAYRPLSMEASLVDLDITNLVAAKDGVVIEAFRGEQLTMLEDFVRREFPGDWQRLARESASGIIAGEISPDYLFLAVEKGVCLGFCRHEGERFGPFGVASSQQGRGIGAALLSNCLLSMKEQGLKRAWFMWTDDRASKLYARFGFREVRRFSVMKIQI